MLHRLALMALLALLCAVAPVRAQTPTSYLLIDAQNNQFNVRGYVCASTKFCPDSVSVDIFGNPLSAPAGTGNLGGYALGTQGIPGGVPFNINPVLSAGSTGTNSSVNPSSIPSDPNFVSLTAIAANATRALIGVQNQSGATIQLVRDDGNGGQQTSIFLTGPFGSWTSTTFKGRLTIYGASGAQVAAYQD